MKPTHTILALLTFFAVVSCNQETKKETSDTVNMVEKADSKSSKIKENPDKNCFFGDLHLHTALSVDANVFGATLGPEASYKYALGEEVEYLGQKVKRHAPLDFLAVTDHAEYLGIMVEVRKPGSEISKTDLGKLLTSSDPDERNKAFAFLSGAVASNTRVPDFEKPEVLSNSWKHVIETAERYNDPGKFTSLVGFEWTSAPGTANKAQQNIHRCVIFKGADVPEQTYSSFDSPDPEDLWTYLEKARATGDDVIAIPHNGNISNGLMFDTKTLSGEPLTKEYAIRRMANEPLTEIAQGKGQSETHPELSPNDEFADYEIYETLLGSQTTAKYQTGSYVRQAYGVGQELQEKLGVNPFKYGLEGGTDYHSALSTTDEDGYPGSHGLTDDQRNPEKLFTEATGTIGEPPVKLAAAGLTGVWAESNTRESIFEALKRKECFGTSGVRMKVRLFAGWDYTADLLKQNNWIKQAYAKGVPMGGDLPLASGNPKFLVQALKDPNSGNLDRIQIIKVTTKNGKSSEKVFDVVWSGDRKRDEKGKVPAVGNTVDMKTATYTNTIGSTELIGYWEDTDFNPDAYTTYYARVLEIPTPRWSTQLAVKNNLPVSKTVPPIIQERAWTSPVWYSPN
ncbi:DUF3604 domain-containing protein [Galbibacter mesophilus]|uniref:DUF3604 domain-containing protein n=1 Tax=Galbibacter mesophilus TaxID=379069 RepID=UPI00191E9ACC|nr:DUF3604 domain-containing protein [Galbibacter mesophilus]MCM5662491.1 DUF3604 domain-containing protein [Galbibacter mesophilus]